MPPALAKVLAYSSERNERHTPPAPPPPNGPSPSMPVNIWLNIVLRKVASKSTALARALLRTCSDRVPFAATGALTGASACASLALLAGAPIERLAITSPRCRPGSRLPPRSLQDRDQVARPDAECVQSVDELLQRDALLDDGELLAFLGHADARARRHPGFAARERLRLAHHRRLGDRDGQVALRHGDGRDPHIASYHDDARALIDDDLGGEIRLDLQLLDLGEQRDHVALELLGDSELLGRRIERLGR